MKPAHPGRYLKYRAARVVDVVQRLTRVQWRFHKRTFVVLGPSGRVFWIENVVTAGSESTRWYVRPDLAACAESVGSSFNIEIDPDGTAPACPAY